VGGIAAAAAAAAGKNKKYVDKSEQPINPFAGGGIAAAAAAAAVAKNKKSVDKSEKPKNPFAGGGIAAVAAVAAAAKSKKSGDKSEQPINSFSGGGTAAAASKNKKSAVNSEQPKNPFAGGGNGNEFWLVPHARITFQFKRPQVEDNVATKSGVEEFDIILTSPLGIQLAGRYLQKRLYGQHVHHYKGLHIYVGSHVLKFENFYREVNRPRKARSLGRDRFAFTNFVNTGKATIVHLISNMQNYNHTNIPFVIAKKPITVLTTLARETDVPVAQEAKRNVCLPRMIPVAS